MPVSKDLSAINMDMDFSEIIVECIRGTQNPQTHHHALLVLTKMAVLFPVSSLQFYHMNFIIIFQSFHTLI